jgi:hypothetical protein
VAVQISALSPDKLDPPHPPDRDGQAESASTVAVATVAGVFTLDHSDLGRLDLNPLG